MSEEELLNKKIVELQTLQAMQLEVLKIQLEITYESLKPVNLLKNTLHDIVTSEEIKDNLLNSVIGISTGYLSKKVLTGTSHNPLVKLAGSLLQFTVANVVTKHPDAIKQASKNILYYFFKRKEEKNQNNEK